MDRLRKVMAGPVATLPVITLARLRIAHLIRYVRNDIARRNLNVQYVVRIEQLDAEADLLATAFVGRHRAYFHKLAEYHQPAVSQRGQYLLKAQEGCRIVIALLLMKDLASQFASEHEKLGTKWAKQAVGDADKINAEALRVFALLRQVDMIPLDLLISDFEVAS